MCLDKEPVCGLDVAIDDLDDPPVDDEDSDECGHDEEFDFLEGANEHFEADGYGDDDDTDRDFVYCVWLVDEQIGDSDENSGRWVGDNGASGCVKDSASLSFGGRTE